MYEIAVCDDCQIDRDRLIKKIQCNQKKKVTIRIHEFCSGIELLNAMKNINFSVVFLDIQMPGLDGEETAIKIREIDTRLLLVFCTGFAQPNPNNFDMEVCRFIRKDMDDQVIDRYVKFVLNKMVEISNVPSILAYHYKTQIMIEAKHIIYIEKFKKSTRIHLAEYAYGIYGFSIEDVKAGPEIRLDGTLECAYEKLKGHGFGCPHSSYIINFSNLCTCTGKNLTLAGIKGDFSIARSKSKEFNQQKALYMKMNCMGGVDSI